MAGKQAALTAVVAATVAFGSVRAPAAESYPARPLRAIVPFTAGSTTDLIARTVGERLNASLGQNVIIDNRAGAGGTVGAAIAAQAPPDGYTLLIHSSSHTVNPAMYAKLPYDTVRDFAGVTPLASIPNVLVISPSKSIRSVKELIAAAKAKPGSINFASAGQGSATHLNAEKFRMRAGINATHIPFKGSPEALVDVMTGRVDYYFCPVAPAIPFIKDGRLLAIAVGSAKRSSILPDIPTTIEAGVPGSDYNFWIGLLVPAKTARPIVTRLHSETTKALASPEVKKRYTELGADPWILSPEQFDATIREEIVANKAIVEAAGLKAN
jgi:tripartite-type tricarboxylate transporter receptor subunit TctC